MPPPPQKKGYMRLVRKEKRGVGGMVTSQIEPCIILFLILLVSNFLTTQLLLFNHSIFRKPLIPCISTHFTILCSAIYSERFG